MSEELNPAELRFKDCQEALDVLTESCLEFIRGAEFPGTYEADMAATHLVHCAWQHANAFSHLTELKPLGSHYIPAQVLCRAAVEAGLTAAWLIESDDWRHREARWLRWVAREEKHRSGLESSMQRLNTDYAKKLKAEQVELARHRIEITELLKTHFVPGETIPELDRGASFEEMLKDLRLVDQIYLRFRFLSHAIHSGPTASQAVLKKGAETMSMYMAHTPSDWHDTIGLIGFALHAPLASLGKRMKINPEKLRPADLALNNLFKCVNALKEVHSLAEFQP